MGYLNIQFLLDACVMHCNLTLNLKERLPNLSQSSIQEKDLSVAAEKHHIIPSEVIKNDRIIHIEKTYSNLTAMSKQSNHY